MAYPNTTLPTSQDPDYGGQAGNRWGSPALAWINSVLQFLEGSFFKVTYVPYTVQYVSLQVSCAAGDVIAMLPDVAISGGGYYARRYVSGQTHVKCWGIALEAASSQNPVRVAISGMVPASVTGIQPGVASADIGLNASTGRMRAAQVGDVIIGRSDGQGNVLFTGYGVSLP